MTLRQSYEQLTANREELRQLAHRAAWFEYEYPEAFQCDKAKDEAIELLHALADLAGYLYEQSQEAGR